MTTDILLPAATPRCLVITTIVDWHLPLTLPGEPAAVERLVDMMASVSDHQSIWNARCQCLVTATFRGLRLPCSTPVRVGGGEPKAQAHVGYVQHGHCRST